MVVSESTHGYIETVTPPSTPPTPNANPLSDVWSDSPPTSPSITSSQTEPSDIPRLRSIHVTAGYRAGITESKTKFLQPGFDEGYPLGATFALRIGDLLGVLEGIYAMLKKIESDFSVEESERLGGLLGEAEEQLALESVFGKEWWGEDGVWKYEVQTKDGSSGMEEGATSFWDVVDAHPLVVKWTELVKLEMEIAGIQKGRFEGAEWERGRIED